jgi:hypothetical protein
MISPTRFHIHHAQLSPLCQCIGLSFLQTIRFLFLAAVCIAIVPVPVLNNKF